MRSIVTASSAVLVALLAVVVMLSAVSGVSADSSTTTTYETTKYVDEYKSGYYGDEYKSGYYPKYKWWAPWTWKYSSNKYNDNKYDSGYDSGYSKYGSGYGYSKYDSKYGVGPYYGKQYEQDEHYPCDTFYPKPKWYSPFTWKYRKYAKFDYYSGPCEVKKEEHCLPFWGKDLPDDASEATWYTVTYASGGGGCHGGAKNGCSTAVMGGDASTGGDTRRRQLLDRPNPRPLYETQYFYAKSEAHGLTFTLTSYYNNNEKWCTACDESRRLVGTKYTSCDPKPFGGEQITLIEIEGDISSLPGGDPSAITVVSFPCMTDSSQEVVFDFGSEKLAKLEELRFANWVTGPDGFFKIDGNPVLTTVDLSALKEAGSVEISGNRELVDVKLPALTTVTSDDLISRTKLEQLSLPKLSTTDSLLIRSNPVLTSVDLSALKEAGIVEIFGNPELVDVKLPELMTVEAFLVINDNENLVGISIPVLETSSFQFSVFNNPSLQTLCAPNLEDGGSVCIGDQNDQQFLDADLSSLVTGTFTSGFPFCYGGGTDPPTNQLNATTVCGKEGIGLFSDFGCPSAGCPETP
ncbi:retinal pigment epithelial membrane protein [Pseudoscourfieldia marina]